MILAAGNSPRTATGFTLIEVLVVMVILALTTSVVLVALPRGESEAGRAADAIALTAGQLADAAIMDGVPRGLGVTDGRLSIFVYADGEWQERAWQGSREFPDVSLSLTPADDFGLQAEEDEGDILLGRRGRGRTDKDEDENDVLPDVIFGPTGDVTPFVARVYGPRSARDVTVSASGAVEVRDGVAP